MSSPNPIKLGAAGSSVLIPDSGTSFATNEYGVQTFIVRNKVGDYTTADNFRPTPGTSYTGSLSVPGTFYADASEVVYIEGTAAELRTPYRRIDPKWINKLNISADLAYDNRTVSAVLVEAAVPIPVISKKYADTARSSNQGVFKLQAQATSEGFPFYGPFNFYSQAAFYLQYLPWNAGWFCTRAVSVPICGNHIYEIEELWKLQYYYFGHS